MATHRRYTKGQKVVAITAALASSTLAAAETSGIPESTLRYWMHDDEFAELRDKARAELAPLATAAAFLAWMEAIRLLRDGKMEPHDVLFFAGLAIDKAQLLTGHATGRFEHRDLAEFTDHETQAIVVAARKHLGGNTRGQDKALVAKSAVEDAGA